MGWRPDVHAGVMQDKVFHMNKFTRQPQRVAGFHEMRPGNPAFVFAQQAVFGLAAAQRTEIALAGHPFVQPRQSVFGGDNRAKQVFQGIVRRIISH